MNRPRCALCGDVIGVYEPLRLFLSDDTMIEGSCLTLRGELQQEGSIAFHHQCLSVAERPEEQRVP